MKKAEYHRITKNPDPVPSWIWGIIISHRFKYANMMNLRKFEKPGISGQNRIPDKICPGKTLHQNFPKEV